MRSETELCVAVRSAMKRRKLKEDQLVQMLNTTPVMIEKLLRGDIMPSRQLETQLIQVLGISEPRVKKMAERREKRGATKKSKAPAKSRNVA